MKVIINLMKITAIAPANIAFIKYWGKKDEKLHLPMNGSISMNLDSLYTTTTVEFIPGLKNDQIILDNNSEIAVNRMITHLDIMRKISSVNNKAKVVSKNNFPAATGLASSASGFAALTLATSHALGLNLSQKELSIIARLGSGSASRSIPDGFVEWFEGESNETSFAQSIFPRSYWEIVDIVLIVSEKEKDILSEGGHQLAFTSPFYSTRLKYIDNKITKIKNLIKKRDFYHFGQLIEAEALELHAITLTSTLSLIYWLPETLTIIKLIQKWRNQGLSAYFTIDAGSNIHLIAEKKNIKTIINKLKNLKEIKKIIINNPGKGARLSNKHLF